MSATAINPLRGVMLNEQWYNYEEGSFKENVVLRNSVAEGQGARNFSVMAATPETYAITLVLQTAYNIHWGASDGGATTWYGISQLQFLKNFAGTGVSLPVTFVTPYGVTVSVVPTGVLDVSEFIIPPDEIAGVEFKVSLTLAEI